MAQVIEIKDLPDFVRDTILGTYKGAQEAQRQHGQAVYGIEDITFELVLVKNGTLNSIERKSSSEQTGDQVNLTEMPEIVTTSKVTRVDSGLNTNKDERTSSDKGTNSGTTQANTEDTDSADETATETQSAQSTGLVTRNTQETTTTEGSE